MWDTSMDSGTHHLVTGLAPLAIWDTHTCVPLHTNMSQKIRKVEAKALLAPPRRTAHHLRHRTGKCLLPLPQQPPRTRQMWPPIHLALAGKTYTARTPPPHTTRGLRQSNDACHSMHLSCRIHTAGSPTIDDGSVPPFSTDRSHRSVHCSSVAGTSSSLYSTVHTPCVSADRAHRPPACTRTSVIV